MTTFTQTAGAETDPAEYVVDPAGAIGPLPGGPPNHQPFFPEGVSADSPESITTTTDNLLPFTIETFQAEVAEATPGLHWFDGFHVIPRSIILGNLLSDQSIALEVYSAFLEQTRTWASFTNNAGAGVTVPALPGLPLAMGPQTGETMTVEVASIGSPFVDTTLDFAFTGLNTIMVPIMVQRLVLWAATPEAPYDEVLSFLTSIQAAKNGNESRSRGRKNPRQAWLYDFLFDEGSEAQTYENLLFDFHARQFGVPVHDDDSELTVAATATDTSITVNSTDFRDYRVGGFAVVLVSQQLFDVIEIASITSTTIGFTSPILNSYPVGTRVFPMAVCHAGGRVRGRRYINNLRGVNVTFSNTDNDSNLADLSAFSSYSGKLLLDGGNCMLSTTLSEEFVNPGIVLIDGDIGIVQQSSPVDRDRRQFQLTVRADGREAKWNLRQMLHAIGGRQVSFYVLGDSPALELDTATLTGGTTLDVGNVGYAQFVRDRSAKNVVRISFVDGSPALIRMVLGSEVISATVDRLTVDSTWAAGFTPAEVSRIEYVEKVRFDQDQIRINHRQGGRLAYMSTRVRTVLE